MNETAATPHRSRRRVFRPFAWWLALVLVLFLIRTHQRLSEQTNLRFEPTMANQRVSYQASTTLDGHEFGSGDRVSIGRHTLSIAHPKTKLFTTNLFIWYGERNLAVIPLERATGVISLHSQPAARRLTIRGPEFSVVVTNTTGLTSSVPTDRYVIEAQFKHTNQSATVEVSSGLTASQPLQTAVEKCGGWRSKSETPSGAKETGFLRLGQAGDVRCELKVAGGRAASLQLAPSCGRSYVGLTSA